VQSAGGLASGATNAWVEIGKVAIPVLLGALVWAFQALAQRAWTDYEVRRAAYVDVVQRIEALFGSREVEATALYLRATRTLWMVGSDQIVKSANALAAGIKAKEPPEKTEQLFQTFINAMRHDLRSRRWLPPGRTTLGVGDFPIEAPGR
jgi:hypothetical protein